MNISSSSGVTVGLAAGAALGAIIGAHNPMSYNARHSPKTAFIANVSGGGAAVVGGTLGVAVASSVSDIHLAERLTPALGWGGTAFGGAAVLAGVGASYLAGEMRD